MRRNDDSDFFSSVKYVVGQSTSAHVVYQREGSLTARDGGRTRQTLAGLRILSPVRLPVPPPRRAFKVYYVPKRTILATCGCGDCCGDSVLNYRAWAT